MSTLQTLSRKEIAAALGPGFGIRPHGHWPKWDTCNCAVCGVAYQAELRRVAEAEAGAS